MSGYDDFLNSLDDSGSNDSGMVGEVSLDETSTTARILIGAGVGVGVTTWGCINYRTTQFYWPRHCLG